MFNFEGMCTYNFLTDNNEGLHIHVNIEECEKEKNIMDCRKVSILSIYHIH